MRRTKIYAERENYRFFHHQLDGKRERKEICRFKVYLKWRQWQLHVFGRYTHKMMMGNTKKLFYTQKKCILIEIVAMLPKARTVTE